MGIEPEQWKLAVDTKPTVYRAPSRWERFIDAVMGAFWWLVLMAAFIWLLMHFAGFGYYTPS